MAYTSDVARANTLLLARLDDCVELCRKKRYPHFMGFLDERETAVARSYLRKIPIGAKFYGGHEESERTFVGVYADETEPSDDQFPLVRIAFLYRNGVCLSHREVLGALLSAGVRREKIGDILCGDGIAVAMVDEDVASFLVEQTDRIGGEGVRAVLDYQGELPVFHRFRRLDGTVSSPRLDAVVKWLISDSRTVASTHIRNGFVLINHCVCDKTDALVKEQDILSIRGFGRFRIVQIGPLTKKERLRISADIYI